MVLAFAFAAAAVGTAWAFGTSATDPACLYYSVRLLCVLSAGTRPGMLRKVDNFYDSYHTSEGGSFAGARWSAFYTCRSCLQGQSHCHNDCIRPWEQTCSIQYFIQTLCLE